MYLKNYFIKIGKDVLIRFPKKVLLFFKFLSEYFQFKRQNDKRLEMRFLDIHPCLSDRIKTTPFDRHYIYHPAWAARILANTKPEYHTDFSSILAFGTIVSAFIPIKFYDYRVAPLSLNNFESGFADLTNLPFDNSSLPSVSCMHTIEHIGLGRYGDKLDPTGDIKAINELKRVVKQSGDILFVVPLGKPMIQFNGQRVYSKDQVIAYFSGCELKDFTLIPDSGELIRDADTIFIETQKFACGCFWFKKIEN